MKRHNARSLSSSTLVLSAFVATAFSGCAPTMNSAGTESIREYGGRCLDAGTDTKVSAWLKGRAIAQCNRCAVEYPTNPDGTQGACPNPEKNLQSWQEVYESEGDLIAATVPLNEICSQNPFTLPFPKTQKVVSVRALGSSNYPAPADTACAGDDIVRFDPSKPVGPKPGAAPGTAPAVTAPATAPVASAPAASVPAASVPAASAPVASMPASTASAATVPVASAPMASAPAASAPVSAAPVAAVPVAAAPVVSAPVPAAPAAPSIAPKFTFIVKSGVNSYLKADYRLQAAQLSDAQKCLLKSNEAVPVSGFTTVSGGGRNVAVVLLQSKCGFAAGTSAFLYADHFQTLPAGLFK